ncbi:MAG: SDR family oxidoreductase [Arcobacter sp.]|jgi:NAD(P)-dependent dehydrogenase (short-subunit alcohol dehydrogenase family)|uniref:SDR family NAD(P)-dependent oxidoreductase n=1 Tax=Arcobacter sp. TaxID=1872629 RepID=UPI002A74C862|nr:SDR family oxidoreductase [Arcobacter sp.]MDY3200341.1 SDR family oxidoreductase [Arcobacter sp.]
MKIALITGGSRGLGKNMALQLAKKSYNIIFTYNNSNNAALEVIKEIESFGQKAFAIKLNTLEVDSFDIFVEEFKNCLKLNFDTNYFDLLINNAGIGINNSFENTTLKEFDDLMNIHIKAPFFLTQKLLPYIKDNGNILNISTGLTRFSLDGFCAYATMKGAVEVMTKYQALELGKRGISVNVIAPGAIETDFGNGVVRDNEEINKVIASKIALGRVGVANDIGKAVANLVSSECKWINGQRIEISGGMCL